MKKELGLITALLLIAALTVPLFNTSPALAAPSVVSITPTAFSSDTTGHNVTMPATVDSGDLLIILFANDGTGGVNPLGGWNPLGSVSYSTLGLSVFYRIATGTEGGTIVNLATVETQAAAAQVYRITNWHGTTPPETIYTIGTNMAPDPPFLNPAGWDLEDTLWIAVAGVDGDPTVNTYPTNYTDGTTTQSGGTGPCVVASARRTLTAASENPGSFSIIQNQEWIACTIAVRPAEVDFGDAPDPTYPTLLASNGARHSIIPGLLLGAVVDSEADGQPSANATNDDVNGIPDDEDGVAFTTPLVQGQQASINVTSVIPAGAAGLLDGWIDFNSDGDWNDIGDQIFAGQVLTGADILDFNVPLEAATGQTFARFRLSLSGQLGPSGLANSGEVEDYQVEIVPRIVPAVGGEAYPINKLAILAPCIALLMLLAGGIGWYALRRRRAQS